MTVADYDMAKDRAFFKEAGYAMLTDEEIRMAVSAIKAHGSVNHGGDSLDKLRRIDNQPGWMFVKTDKATIEYAKRAAQAVLQYQSYKAGELEAAIEKGRNYATDALGGFIQPIVNAPVNIINGVSEPFRAAERISFGTRYIPEIPRMQVAERSEYWNKDGRMVINRGAEIGTTILLGGAAGGKAIGTQAGRIFLGTESAYNIGAGIFGRDVTQPDAQGNARQMPMWERGLRITGGVFGARQTIKTEIATPNSTTNRAADKLDDVFKNTPTFKPQGEFVTPQGFGIGRNTFEKPLQTADDLNSKIVTVDSKGKPSGTRFRDDYQTHIKEREFTKASQKTGVSGAHDINELEKYVVKAGAVQAKESINIVSKTPHPTVAGIYKIEYQMPKLDTKGQPTNLWRNRTGEEPFIKTVYDSKVISDQQMTQWGREAFADAVQTNNINLVTRRWEGISFNGLKFGGFLDSQSNAVRTFFPEF